jgi:hypothetical protein
MWKIGLHIEFTVGKDEEQVGFERRDTEAYVEHAGPQRVGFQIPGDEEDRRG